MAQSDRRQINFRADKQTQAAIEALRRTRSPIPKPGDVIKEAVIEKLARETKPSPRKKYE